MKIFEDKLFKTINQLMIIVCMKIVLDAIIMNDNLIGFTQKDKIKRNNIIRTLFRREDDSLRTICLDIISA